MWGPKSAEARERAAELRVQLRSGVDPVEKRKSERAAMRAESAKLRASEAVAHECHKVRQSEPRNEKDDSLHGVALDLLDDFSRNPECLFF